MRAECPDCGAVFRVEDVSGGAICPECGCQIGSEQIVATNKGGEETVRQETDSSLSSSGATGIIRICSECGTVIRVSNRAKEMVCPECGRVRDLSVEPTEETDSPTVDASDRGAATVSMQSGPTIYCPHCGRTVREPERGGVFRCQWCGTSFEPQVGSTRQQNSTRVDRIESSEKETMAASFSSDEQELEDTESVDGIVDDPEPQPATQLARTVGEGQGGDEVTERRPRQDGTVVAHIPKDEATVTGTEFPAGESEETGIVEWVQRHLGLRYEILQFVGRGGMGAVFKVKQKEPSRIVALKVMRSAALSSEKARKRFEREAAAAARLQHPAIVPVYEVGEVRGQPYYTMAFVDGKDLREHVFDNECDKKEIAHLIKEVCDAVDYAHRHGVIHRDLKPGNIMIDVHGQIQILDFGLARVAREEGEAEKSLLTMSGDVIGTPRYMSPEQAMGKPDEIDGRTDVYTLGVILYELTVGMPPYNIGGLHGYRALNVIQESEPIIPSRVHPVFPIDLEAVILKALAKNKEERYRKPIDLGADLERFIADRPVSAQAATLWYRFQKFLWRNRRSALWVLLVTFLFGLTGGILGGLYFSTMQKKEDLASRMREMYGSVGKMIQDVRKQVEEEDWGKAFANARLAEKAFPGEAQGLVSEVQREAQRKVQTELSTMRECVRAQKYREAGRRADQMLNLAADLPSGELKGGLLRAGSDLPEVCWRELQSMFAERRLYTREGTVKYLQNYIQYFDSKPRAEEARKQLQEIRQAPDTYFLQRRLEAIDRRLEDREWEKANEIIQTYPAAIHDAAGADENHWQSEMVQRKMALASVIWQRTIPRVKVLRRIEGHTKFIKSIGFNPSRDLCEFVSGGTDSTVRIWECDTGCQKKILPAASEVRAVKFSPEGMLVGAGCEEGTLHLFLRDSEYEWQVQSGHVNRLQCLDFSENGERILTGSADAVHIWRVGSGGMTHFAQLEGARAPAVFVPERDWIVSAKTTEGREFSLSIRDSGTGKVFFEFDVSSPPLALAVGAEGKLLAAGCKDDNVRLWDLKRKKLQATLSGHERNVAAVAFTPDARVLASGAWDDQIILWDVRSPEEPVKLRALKDHEGWIHDLAFSPDSRFLVSVGNEPIIRVWAVEQGR
ncbi:MAG: protein kinase domain-containing protein [Candidatus Brocadiia bacterium]